MPNTAPDTVSALASLLVRAESLLDRLDGFLPRPAVLPDLHASIAFRWRRRGGVGALVPVAHPHRIAMEDLQGVET